ncbi:MAG: 1,4-alpha-glucan branching protein GlgB [Desulfobulbaceae bacterium]|nr:1,4-alpha-glucan branching protein GlgB [Desulfobulbaceae bacterium]
MTIDITHELDKVIASDHHDPFVVLGLHVLEHDPGSAIIRAFLPLAESVRLVFGDEKRDMYKMRDEGLFEIVIPDYAEPFDYSFEATAYNNTIHTFKDPYCFLPQLSEFDRHLFNSGTHYQLYEKMGAHPATINGVDGTIFRVWAPAARRVSVIGNFNYWDGRVHQMRVLGSSGIWELFIPEVKQGEIYKYEIRTPVNDIVEKADPFQFLTELRPKSASIVWDINDYSWHDEEWLQKRGQNKFYDHPVSIYEVHLGSWQRDPSDPERFLTFRELADKLIPYVKEMSFTHIELMPIMEHPLDESWGYQTTGYYAVTSRFGTPQDFMYFVDCCHQNDIGVILDWVPSHFPTDGHSLGRFDGTALYEHEDPRQGSHPEWKTLIFNYSRREVENFLIANGLFWLEKYHIDAIRVDAVASMLYLDYGRKDDNWIPNPYGGKENLDAINFIKHLNSIVYERHPDVAMIAEESTSFYGVSKPTDQGGLGFGFKWNMGWMNDMLDYFSRDPLFRKYHHNKLTFSLLYAFSENFILPLSHDEVVHGKKSLLSKMPGDRWQQFANLRLIFFFLWTHPGKKLLFMGGEFGQISEWYCKVSLDWHLPEQEALHYQIQYYVQKLNDMYKSQPALWEVDFSYEGFKWLDFKDVDQSIITFARFAKNPADHVVCLLNMTPEVHHNYKVGVLENTKYEEIFCSDESSFGGSDTGNPDVKVPYDEPYGEAPYHIKVTVPPLSGIIFRPVRS